MQSVPYLPTPLPLNPLPPFCPGLCARLSPLRVFPAHVPFPCSKRVCLCQPAASTSSLPRVRPAACAVPPRPLHPHLIKPSAVCLPLPKPFCNPVLLKPPLRRLERPLLVLRAPTAGLPPYPFPLFRCHHHCCTCSPPLIALTHPLLSDTSSRFWCCAISMRRSSALAPFPHVSVPHPISSQPPTTHLAFLRLKTTFAQQQCEAANFVSTLGTQPARAITVGREDGNGMLSGFASGDQRPRPGDGTAWAAGP